jgi:hypothetical protein
MCLIPAVVLTPALGACHVHPAHQPAGHDGSTHVHLRHLFGASTMPVTGEDGGEDDDHDDDAVAITPFQAVVSDGDGLSPDPIGVADWLPPPARSPARLVGVLPPLRWYHPPPPIVSACPLFLRGQALLI